MVVSYAYLKLLIFLPAILIQSSSSSTFLMMYSTYKLNKQGDNRQSWHSFPHLEPIYCPMFSSNCCFLISIQSSQEAGKVVWYSHLFKNFPEYHWNMYIIICETDHQPRFDAWDRVLRAGPLGWPRRMRWWGRWEVGSGWWTHVHPWLIHVNVWQKPLQYSKVINLQLK